MITYHVSAQPLAQSTVDVYALCCDDTYAWNNTLEDLSTRYYAPLRLYMEHHNFQGRVGESVIVNGSDGTRPVLLVVLGLGSIARSQSDRLDRYRRALGTLMRATEQVKMGSIALMLPDEHWFAVDAYTIAKETVATIAIASYHFDQYITDPTRKHRTDYTVTLIAPELLHKSIKVGIDHGGHLGFAVNQARHWCDLPPCVLTPTHMAEHAERIAKSHNLTYTIFNQKQISDMNMGGLIAVSQGSVQECRLVVLEYRTHMPDAPTIALVGKGVTFDSGGLSIKPALRMYEMKDDMAGAAAVISTMELLAHLRPEINVIGIAPITENLPSGSAIKPGDIIQFYNGKTAEIRNTDAEGRLILADALSYAVKQYKLDAIINIATLTGSCSAALGPFFCGLMSQHDDLSHRIFEASRVSGDRAWPLPFHDDFAPAVRSTAADLCNEGNAVYRAGAITAGFFLKNFVDDVPWVHLDIAGTSFNVPHDIIKYYRPGATGFGVRLFAELIMKWNQVA
jgi:leucyl aminopeptidase